MDTNKFDVILDMADENFVEDLMKAIGVEQGDTVEVVTPTFDRTDERDVTYLPSTPEEYVALEGMKEDKLKTLGCQVWERKWGTVHWLYPAEWYDHIPNETEVVGLCGDREKFERGVTSDDRRFGALGYGFIQQEQQTP